jgi:zinc protease
VIKFPAEPKAKDFHFTSQLPRALFVVCWPTAGTQDVLLRRKLNVLAEVLSDRLRLKIREELGATYTTEASSNATDTFPDYGYIMANMTVEPKQVDVISRLAAAVGDELANGQISDDEFNRAIQPFLASLEHVTQSNGYWVSTLCESQERPATLEHARRMGSDFKSITKDDIQTLAKRFLMADKATIVNIAPTETK